MEIQCHRCATRFDDSEESCTYCGRGDVADRPMTPERYKRYREAVESGLKGLSFISSGACPGCAECGLDTVPCETCEGSGDDPREPFEDCLQVDRGPLIGRCSSMFFVLSYLHRRRWG